MFIFEKDSASGGGAEREMRDTESEAGAGSESTEPAAGLELMNRGDHDLS